MKTTNGYFGKVIINNKGKVVVREYDRVYHENEERQFGTGEKRHTKEEEIIEKRSYQRTKNKLFELVENNEELFCSFITLTFKEEIENVDIAYQLFRDYIKKVSKYFQRKSNDKLIYIAVPEVQNKRAKKTGKKVIHFHLITNIKCNSFLIPKREKLKIKGSNYTGTKTIEYYDLKYWNEGFSFAIPIENNDSKFSLGKYLAKYLSKDIDNHFFGRQKILHSRNLKTNEEIKIYTKDFIEYLRKNLEPFLLEKYYYSSNSSFVPSIIDEISIIEDLQKEEIVKKLNKKDPLI